MLTEKKILVEDIAAAAAVTEVCKSTCLNQLIRKILKK